MHSLACGLRLASPDAGDTPAPPLNNKTPAMATDRLLCALPCVCTALYVDYGSLRSMRGTLPHPDSITRLLRWLLTAFCVHRLVCTPPSIRSALCMHRLVCGLQLASLDAGDTPAPPLNNKSPAMATDCLSCATPCIRTALCMHRLVCGLRLALLDGGDTPTPPLNNKTPTMAHAAFCVHCLVYALPCMWTMARFAQCRGHPRTPLKQQISYDGTYCLLSALPCVCLVYAPPSMWTMARFARCGGQPHTPLK